MTTGVPRDLTDHQDGPQLAAPDVSARVVLLLGSDEALSCTGTNFVVAGGLAAGEATSLQQVDAADGST